MEAIAIDSFGKINLSLDVVNKREDGYHNIRTIMQEIDLKDRIEIEPRPSGIVIESNCKSLPLDRRNLVYRAWEEMQKSSGLDRGVKIYIEKNIPIGAGLAGGSSNAAAVLKGLNRLWELDYSLEKLQEIGLGIGADVPFCLQGGTAYAEGIGEKLRPLRSLKGLNILLANNGVSLSTPYVYQALEIGPEEREVSLDRQLELLEEGDLVGLSDNLVNLMERVVLEENPQLIEIKNTMLENGALASLMTGSGPTIFGIYQDEDGLKESYRLLKNKMDRVYICKTR